MALSLNETQRDALADTVAASPIFETDKRLLAETLADELGLTDSEDKTRSEFVLRCSSILHRQA